MKARTIVGLVLAAALGAAGYAAARDGADRMPGGGVMGGGMMGGGMKGGGMKGGGMAGMMDGCRDMMQADGTGSGQPNAQWGDRTRKVPPAKTQKP
ncbi:MAG: hypothetical protein ACREVS_04750 [Burkholderiales bacterium]